MIVVLTEAYAPTALHIIDNLECIIKQTDINTFHSTHVLLKSALLICHSSQLLRQKSSIGRKHITSGDVPSHLQFLRISDLNRHLTKELSQLDSVWRYGNTFIYERCRSNGSIETCKWGRYLLPNLETKVTTPFEQQ